MIRNRVSRAPLFFVLFGILGLFTLNFAGLGQAAGGVTQKDVSYDNHVYTFKILGSGMGQILKDGQVVGTILPDGNGGEKVIGLSSVTPPPDVLVAYGMYKAGAAGNQAGGAAANTATFPDGTVVTFVDKEHAKLHWPTGYSGSMDFDLVYHGGSAGGFMKGVARSNQGVMGQSFGGSGVKFMLAATANTRSAEVFDTGEGTTIYMARMDKFKPMIHAVLQAADAAAAAGHSVNDWQVVKSIRSNNLGIK